MKWSLKNFRLLAPVWNGVWNSLMRCRLQISLQNKLRQVCTISVVTFYITAYETVWNSMKWCEKAWNENRIPTIITILLWVSVSFLVLCCRLFLLWQKNLKVVLFQVQCKNEAFLCRISTSTCSPKIICCHPPNFRVCQRDHAAFLKTSKSNVVWSDVYHSFHQCSTEQKALGTRHNWQIRRSLWVPQLKVVQAHREGWLSPFYVKNHCRPV